MWRRIATMGYTTEIGAAAQQSNTAENPMASNGTKSKRRAALAASVDAIGTAEALARRQVMLVCPYGCKDECAHESSGRARSRQQKRQVTDHDCSKRFSLHSVVSSLAIRMACLAEDDEA